METYRTIIKRLAAFSLPLILSAILQQLYSWADAFIVGNVEGQLALAAVGATGAIVNFLINAITGFTLGLAILFAQRQGQGREKEMGSILSTFTIVLGLVFTVLAALAVAFTDEILIMMDTTEDTIELASSYLSIVFMGVPFLAVYNTFSAAVRGRGDSRSPFYAVLVSSLVNVVLDILFVAVFHWSVAGAAIATLLSQIAMTVFLVIHSLAKHPCLRFRRKSLFSTACLKDGLHFSIPPMLQSSVTSVGSLILQNFMNSFGTATVAAITTAYRIDQILLIPIFNLSSGISTMGAQCVGAGNRKGAERILSAGLLLMGLLSAALTLIVIPTGGFLISLFGAGEEAVAIGSAFFVRLAAFYVVFGLANAIRGYIEGLGDVVYSSAAGMISLAVRIAGSYAMRPLFGNMVIAWAEVVAWIVLLALYVARLFVLKRRAILA